MTIETVHVKEVWMALPDMVMVLIRDQETVFYPPVALVSPDAGNLGTNYQRTNPHTGGTEWAAIISPDKMYLKFGDKFPTAFADRTALDDPSNWAAIGTRTVTAVYRKSRPYDQARALIGSSTENRTATMEHFCYLQLDGNLAQGGPYDIECTGAGFTATTFTFNENSTRAECIHTTQVGHRPGDGLKEGSASLWIPGYGTEGQIDLITELGSADYDIIDANDDVVFSGTFTLRTEPDAITDIIRYAKAHTITSADATTNILTVSTQLTSSEGDRVVADNHTGTLPVGLTHGNVYFMHKLSASTCTLHTTAADAIANTNPVDITATGTGTLAKLYDYPSTTVAPKVIEAITVANPAVFTITGHGYSVGQVLFPKRIAGMTQLETKNLRVLSIPTTDTFTCQIQDNSGDWATLSTASGYSAFSATGIYPAHNNEMVVGHYANQAATNSYKFDYSALTTPGTYRLRIPGLGVGDPFRLHEGVYHTVLKTMVKGLYNQITGYALDSNIGGVDRPVMAHDGANDYNIIYESLLPAWFASENFSVGSPILSGEAVNTSTWARAETTMGTVTRATGFRGGWSDAGDVDWHVYRHAMSMYNLLEHGYRKLPSGSRDIKAGFPNLTDLLDATTYAGTDGLGDAVAMSLIYFDCLRVHQKVDGRVYSGLAFGNPSVNSSGINSSITEPAYLTRFPYALHAADPIANFYYAIIAAKTSQIFTLNGFTTLAATWKASAELAYEWADDLLQDYIANGATGSLVQAYFVTKLNMKTNAGWSDPTFATMMASVFGTNCTKAKNIAACVLMNISAADSIYEDYVTSLGAYPFGEADPIEKWATWEYAEAAVPPANQTYKDYWLGRRINTASGQNNAIVTNNFDAIRSNNSYPFLNNDTTLWQGGANTFVYQALHHQAPANPQTSVIFNLIQGGIAAMLGANQQNLCCTIGLGERNPIVLHREREAMGLKTEDWPGITCYTWWNGNNGGVAVFNLGNSDSTLTYTNVVSIADPEKVIEPDYRSYGAFENHWGNTNFITHTEFTTQQSIIPTFISVALLHAFDGNTEIEAPPSVPAITGSFGLQF